MHHFYRTPRRRVFSRSRSRLACSSSASKIAWRIMKYAATKPAAIARTNAQKIGVERKSITPF